MKKSQEATEPNLLGVPIFATFLRCLALVLLGVSILYWARIIGINGPDISILFEVAPEMATIYCGLGVILPALGVGLWLLSSWAFILWFAVSAGLLFYHFVIVNLWLDVYMLAASLFILMLLYISGHTIYKIINKDHFLVAKV